MQFGQQYKVLALVSMYSPLHAGLFEALNGTVLSCTYYGAASANIKVIDISSIVLFVAMVPHDLFPNASGDKQEQYFVQKSLDWKPQY
jgi:hypothetical protein